MPNTLLNFSSSETRMRFREPFVTEGLNSKLAVALAPGLYRGFRLAATGSATPRTVQVVADTVSSDNICVYQTATGFSLSLKKSGNFTVDLSSATYDNTSVVITIFAAYATGSTTTAAIKAYTVAEYDAAPEKAELLVLGTVVVGAAAVAITAANVTYNRRTEAWEKVASQSLPYEPLLRNQGFEWSQFGDYSLSSLFWESETTVGGVAAAWLPDDSDPATGSTYDMTYVHAAPAVTGQLYQLLNVPVVTGQLVKYTLDVKAIQAATGGTCVLFLTFIDGTGVPISDVTVNIPLTAPDGSYRTLSGFVKAPTNANFLHTVGVKVAAITFALDSAAFRLDNIQFWLERRASIGPNTSQERIGATLASPLIIPDKDEFDLVGGFGAAKLDYIQGATPTDAGTLRVRPLNPAADPTILSSPGPLQVGSVTSTGAISGTTATLSGAISAGGNVDTTGSIASDDFYHSNTLEYVIPPSAFKFNGTDWTFHAATASASPAPSDIESGASGNPANAPVNLPTDAVISEITVFFDKQANTIAFAFVETVITTGSASALVANTNLPGAATGLISHTFGPLTIRIGQGIGNRMYECAVSSSGASALILGVRIKYTRPRP